VSNPADLAVGVHTLTLTLGAAAGQLALPGAGLADPDMDYHLIVLADRLRTVAENDADPFNEDNVVLLTGAYHVPGGAVHVHGGLGDDNVTIAANGAGFDLNLNGIVTTYA